MYAIHYTMHRTDDSGVALENTSPAVDTIEQAKEELLNLLETAVALGDKIVVFDNSNHVQGTSQCGQVTYRITIREVGEVKEKVTR